MTQLSAGCWQQTLRISTISTKVVPVHVRADVITSSSPLPRRPQQNGNPFIVFSLRLHRYFVVLNMYKLLPWRHLYV